MLLKQRTIKTALLVFTLVVQFSVLSQSVDKDTLAVWEKIEQIENEILVLKNEGDLVPIEYLDIAQIATISIGSDGSHFFADGLKRYANIHDFYLDKTVDEQIFQKTLDSVSYADCVILSLHGLKQRDFRITVSRLAKHNQTIYTTHSPFLVGPGIIITPSATH